MDVKSAASIAIPGGVVGGSGPPALPVDDLVQDRFQQALEGPVSAPGAGAPTPDSLAVRPGGSLGDAILSGLDRLGADFQQAWAGKSLTLDSDPSSWTPAQLLQLQVQTQTASTVIDVMGKGVSKVVQGIEQLTKVQ